MGTAAMRLLPGRKLLQQRSAKAAQRWFKAPSIFKFLPVIL
jgi:hypothetical protein